MKGQNGVIKEKSKFFYLITSCVFICFVLYMTMGQNPDFLRKIQELDLFLCNAPFFFDSIKQIGGLSIYLSTFLNQFFYYPLAGSVIFLVLLLFVSILTSKTFNLKGTRFPLAFIPSLALLLSLTELGYMIYFQKVDGFVYNNILGIIVAVSGLQVYRKRKRLLVKVLFSLAFILIGYHLAGAYALFGGLLMLVFSVKHYFKNKQRLALIPTIAIAASIILVPLFYYEFVYVGVPYSQIYSAGLPNFKMNGAEIMLWLPYLFLAAYFIFLILWEPKEEQTKRSFLIKALPLVAFASSLVMVYLLSFKDANFNMELSMQSASENEDWNEVLKLARKQKDEPTRLIVMNTNLALYKLGMASDNMFHYKNGNKEINSPRAIFPVQMAGTMFYYQYGLLNFCNKWCMEGLVEYGLNVSVLKYFVLSSLLNGEFALSNKYNGVLHSTLFYKPWALKHQNYIDHPETISNSEEFKNILALTAYEDDVTLDFDNLEAFLRIHFSKMREVSKELTELSVLYNLDIKNNERFWPRLFRWIKFYPTKKMPVHFQEAAILYGNLEGQDLSGAPFDESVKANYANFQDLVKQYNGYPLESMKTIFYHQFGNTFWYYYFFVNDPETKKKEDKGYQN